MEGEFLKMPNEKVGNTFVRKKKGLDEKKFQNIKKDWENREIRDGHGQVGGFLERYEVKKNPEQMKAVEFAVDEVNKILEKYGPDKNLKASSDLVKFFDPSFFEERGIPQAAGISFPEMQVAIVSVDRNTTKSMIAAFTFHELMHLVSFSRIVLKGGHKSGYGRRKLERTGAAVIDSEDERIAYFNFLNEAINSHFDRMFYEKIKESDLFNQDKWEIKNLYRDHRKAPPVLLKEVKEDGTEDFNAVSTYQEEHEKFTKFMRDIQEKNSDEFSSTEEVFDMFAHAYFTGRLLPMARLIEKTYGKGFFRKVAEETKGSI